MVADRSTLAVFIDFENLALGFKDRKGRFQIKRVLARLVEKGDIVAKRAYADWKRFSAYTTELHEAAIDLIEVPHRAVVGKNSADMRLCVDALDLSYSKPHIGTFVILSGDSDFSPLVSKLKENGKQVVGLGMRESTSDLLRDNCHEFIYYEDLEAQDTPSVVPLDDVDDDKKKKALSLLLESLEALRRENRDTLWSSLIKETMKRKKPSFNETFFGYRTFSRLLEDAASRGLVELGRDSANRSYVVTRFGAELAAAPRAEEDGGTARSAPRRGRRRAKPART